MTRLTGPLIKGKDRQPKKQSFNQSINQPHIPPSNPSPPFPSLSSDLALLVLLLLLLLLLLVLGMPRQPLAATVTAIAIAIAIVIIVIIVIVIAITAIINQNTSTNTSTNTTTSTRPPSLHPHLLPKPPPWVRTQTNNDGTNVIRALLSESKVHQRPRSVGATTALLLSKDTVVNEGDCVAVAQHVPYAVAGEDQHFVFVCVCVCVCVCA